MGNLKPIYPIYIVSKGRSDVCLTAKFLIREEVPFHIVVEPQEQELYAAQYGEERLYVLPFRDRGLPVTRQWVREHSIAAGDKRHWQFDDNMRGIYRWYRGKRIWCDSGSALSVTEEFVDRYTNVAIGGLNYHMFARNPPTAKSSKIPPFRLNCHVYSCMLMLNEISNDWRGRYNEDVDMNLQVLADGWCTIQMNLFVIDKLQTMTVKGGNTDELYDGDGRLYMARALERKWPGVVRTTRRFGRPQHSVRNSWQSFDNKLIRRTDIDFDNLASVDEHGLHITQVKPEVKSKRLQGYLDDPSSINREVPSFSLVDIPPSQFLNAFLDKYASMFPVDKNVAKKMIDQILAHRQADKTTALPMPQHMLDLEYKWYASLETGNPDYSVYDDDYAFTEMWVCWAIYSRNYLRILARPDVHSIVKDIKAIADLGCGIGYTTAGFKQLFPDSEVTGTNIEGTRQYDFCAAMGESYGFEMASDIKKLGQVDLVFVSEYFEHILAPITHLEEVLSTLSPKFLYVANSFNTHSVGHFNHYSVDHNWLPAGRLSEVFNKTLQNHGYKRLNIKAWNNKPSLWAKDSQSI